jgi:hypothetical protein
MRSMIFPTTFFLTLSGLMMAKVHSIFFLSYLAKPQHHSPTPRERQPDMIVREFRKGITVRTKSHPRDSLSMNFRIAISFSLAGRIRNGQTRPC